ncbi:hypothetical protein ACFS07_14200 [Undibacterium arcticum]
MPLISMALDCQAKPALHLKQERYQPGGKASPASQQLWNAPVCVRYEGQKVGPAVLHHDARTGNQHRAAGCR